MDFEPCLKVHKLISVQHQTRSMIHLNMIFHVVVSNYRLLKIWNSSQLVAQRRNALQGRSQLLHKLWKMKVYTSDSVLGSRVQCWHYLPKKWPCSWEPKEMNISVFSLWNPLILPWVLIVGCSLPLTVLILSRLQPNDCLQCLVYVAVT